MIQSTPQRELEAYVISPQCAHTQLLHAEKNTPVERGAEI